MPAPPPAPAATIRPPPPPEPRAPPIRSPSYPQADKRDDDQPSMTSQLQPLAPNASLDVLVVGCGPAGLYLAAQLAQRGLSVGLVGELPRAPPARHAWAMAAVVGPARVGRARTCAPARFACLHAPLRTRMSLHAPACDPTALRRMRPYGRLDPPSMIAPPHETQQPPGPDKPFVNNYGVWVDEFKAVGMDHTLELTFPDAQCWFGEGHKVGGRGGVWGRRGS